MTTPIPPNAPRWVPSADPSTIVVPGLDTTASVNDQIDQIEQLITIKLQNIDANFSKIQHLMANKLLPAVKKYAVSTEPVREAAKFWTSFYEQAAQVRIPTYDESSVQEQQSQSEEHQADETRQDHSVAPSDSESSFMPGQGAVSSTPATSSRHHPQDQTFDSQHSDDPSWAASMESPLVRLDRELQSFDKDEDESRYEEEPTVQQPRAEKGKAKEQPGPLLHNVLRQNHNATADDSSSSFLPQFGVSPLKFHAKGATPKPASLEDSLFASPQRPKYERVRRTPARHTPRRPIATPVRDLDDSFDDSDLMAAMSPPVNVQFAQASPFSAARTRLLQLGRTPKSAAADRIKKDLLGYMDSHGGSRSGVARSFAWAQDARGGGGAESSMSTVPTPPSISRYTRHAYPGMDSESSGMEASLESMLRRVGLPAPGSAASSSHAVSAPRSEPGAAGAELQTPDQQRFDDLFPEVQAQDSSVDMPIPGNTDPDTDSDSDSDSDSFAEEVHNAAHPSAAFLMASQGHEGGDDSFGSSNRSSDSLDDIDPGHGGAVHPFAAMGMGAGAGDAFDDDSFDDSQQDIGGAAEEETVFGVPPARRQAAAPPRAQGLRMLGEDLLDDTIGIGQAMARAGRLEESPTPYSGAR